MYVDVAGQARVFLQSILIGAGLGLVYDVLRAVRRSLKSRGTAFLLDLLFWLGVTGLLFWLALFRENGQVRLYLAAALLLGGGGYLLTLSRQVLPFLLKILELLAKFWGWITAPARKGAELVKKVCSNQKKDFQNWIRWYKITMDYYYPECCEKGASDLEGQARRRRYKNPDTRPSGSGGDSASVHAFQADGRAGPAGSASGTGPESGGGKQRTGRRHRPQHRSGVHRQHRQK